MLLVVKMRRSQHSIDMVGYQITAEGVVIGEPLRGYEALTSGIPSLSPIPSTDIPPPHHEGEGEPPDG
jgi:hypothetical protein